jgi:hypothetical protein
MNEELNKKLIGELMELDFNEADVLWRSGSLIMYRHDMERLIDLVVKECLEVMRNNYYGDPHHVIEAEEHIKDHFGVE